MSRNQQEYHQNVGRLFRETTKINLSYDQIVDTHAQALEYFTDFPPQQQLNHGVQQQPNVAAVHRAICMFYATQSRNNVFRWLAPDQVINALLDTNDDNAYLYLGNWVENPQNAAALEQIFTNNDNIERKAKLFCFAKLCDYAEFKSRLKLMFSKMQYENVAKPDRYFYFEAAAALNMFEYINVADLLATRNCEHVVEGLLRCDDLMSDELGDTIRKWAVKSGAAAILQSLE